MSICRWPVQLGFSGNFISKLIFFFSLQSSCLFRLLPSVTLMHLPLTPGVGDPGGGKSTEQGKLL